VAAGGTVVLDHFCRSGNVSVACTGGVIAQVVNAALDARDLRLAIAG